MDCVAAAIHGSQWQSTRHWGGSAAVAASVTNRNRSNTAEQATNSRGHVIVIVIRACLGQPAPVVGA